jgi:hypothetical protein
VWSNENSGSQAPPGIDLDPRINSRWDKLTSSAYQRKFHQKAGHSPAFASRNRR